MAFITTGDEQRRPPSLVELPQTGNQRMDGIHQRMATTTRPPSLEELTTSGNHAFGIYNYGNRNTTTISGTVKATGASSAALYNEIRLWQQLHTKRGCYNYRRYSCERSHG